MSGEKQVILREGEYNRIMQTVCEVDNQQARNKALERQLTEARLRINEVTKASERRLRAFDSAVDNLSSDLKASTQKFSHKLHQQQKLVDQQMDELGRRVDQKINTLEQKVDHGFQQVEQRISSQRKEYLELLAQQTDQFNQQFARIEKREQKAEQTASQWSDDTKIILDHIRMNQDHARFKPGELGSLDADFRLCQSNIGQGHYEAAIATAQALFSKALALQAELEFLQSEWDQYYGMAQEDARKLLAECESQQTAQWVLETSDGSQSLDSEIDYWSDGELVKLHEQVSRSLASLDRQRDSLSLEQIKQHIKQTGDSFANLNNIVSHSKERLIASQLRVNIAQDLADELEKRGWQVCDSTWEGCDKDDGRGWKNSYHMKLRNMGNEEMVTVIIPESTAQGEILNRVQFAYFPNTNDAKFAENQTQHIGQILQEQGHNGKLECVSGYEKSSRGDDSRRDFGRVRNKASSSAETN